MTDAFIIFILGLTALLVSTYHLIKLAKKISLSLKISSLIIGFIVVGIGTSLPELSVSLIALIKKDPGLSLGNIIGSNIANSLFIFPVGILIKNLRVGTTKTQRNSLVLLLATCLFIYLSYFYHAPFSPGLILLPLAFIFTFVEYKWAVVGRTHEDIKQFKSHKKTKISFLDLIFIFFTLAGIILGGIIVVSASQKISILSGYSTSIIGLTITAIATSLPELLTTILSQEEHEEKLALGNILGSNIYNLLMIGGIIFLYPGLLKMPLAEYVWLGISTVAFIFVIKVNKGKNIPRIFGVILILIYILYLLFLRQYG